MTTTPTTLAWKLANEIRLRIGPYGGTGLPSAEELYDLISRHFGFTDQPAQSEPSAERELPMILGERPMIRPTRDYGYGDPQGWYIADKRVTHELRRDGQWHYGFDAKEPVWPTREAAKQFVLACAAKERDAAAGPLDKYDAETEVALKPVREEKTA